MTRFSHELPKFVWLIFALTTVATSFAREVTWTGAQDDFWDVNANWIDDENPPQMLQPFVGDNAIIPGVSTPTVRFLEQINNLTNTGVIQVNSTLEMRGDSIDNGGTISIGDGTNQISQLIFSNPFDDGLSPMLTGGGEIVLQKSPGAGGIRAQLTGSNSTDPTTHAADHIIRGEGQIGGAWINEGLIRAEETDGTSGAVLRIDNATIANNSELRSSATAMLEINATINNGAGGQIIADIQSVNLRGGLITGGSLETTGGGLFDANGLVTLSGVTINAPIDNSNTSGTVNDGRLFVDGGGITNNSTITLAGQNARNSQFGFTSSGTLAGTGEIVLAGGNTQTFIGVFPGTPAQFTQAASHTIRGAGAINAPIINNGTILAEPGTDGATLQISGGQTNNHRIDAGAGATLLFTSTVFGAPQITQGPSGVIAALDGGIVTLNGGSYSGGSFETVGTGVVTLLSNNPTLTNVTNRGTFNVPGGRAVSIAGAAFTNDGVVTLNHDDSNSVGQLIYTEDITLDGVGEVILQSAANASRVVPFGGDHTLTHGADHTIRGFGFLSGTIVNQGKLEGDSAAEPLTIFADLSGEGPLENVEISGSVFSGFSVHSPGNSTAVVPMDGLYRITSAGTLAMEFGGTTPGDHDQLASTGSVELDGTLDVSLVDLSNGYTPAAGDQFEIITAIDNTITGTFQTANFPQFALGHALTWQPIDYTPGAVTLEIATATPYDVDRDDDGDVDGLDFLALQREDPSLIPAWQFEYGNAPGAVSSSTTAVPEPGAIALASLCWGVWCLGFCRKELSCRQTTGKLNRVNSSRAVIDWGDLHHRL